MIKNLSVHPHKALNRMTGHWLMEDFVLFLFCGNGTEILGY